MLYSRFDILPRSVVRRQTGFAARITRTLFGLKNRQVYRLNSMKFGTKHLFVAITLIACICLIASVIFRATKTRVIVSEDLPNGTRVRVIQTFSGEPFNTSIYFDDGDGRWRWYYFDHEDWYWNHANTRFAKEILYITSGERFIAIDTNSGQCDTDGSQIGKSHRPKSARIVDLPE